MSDYLHHRPDCKFPSAPIYVCGCVKENMADRIEELEAKLAKAVTEFRKLGEAAKAHGYGSHHIKCHNCSDTHHAVDAILAELTGGKDE